MKPRDSSQMIKPKIVFFGNERLATGTTTKVPVLNAIIKAGYEIEAVIANHVDSVSRQSRELEIGTVAHQHGIPIILPGHKIALADKVVKHRSELGILVAFGQIVSQQVLDMFPMDIINIHPSLLPQLRGSTPIESTILQGDTKTGVSLMQLVAEMDAGPVYAQRELKLSGTETKQELVDKLGEIGADLLIEALPAIIDGKLQPSPQSGEPTFTKRIAKTDGQLDPAKFAIQLEREVRAYAGWPKSYLDMNDLRIVIHRASVSDQKTPAGKLTVADKKLYFGCEDSSLEILELQPAGKSKMNAKAFINGYFQ